MVILIYQIHHHLHHHILFLRAALGYHQRKCHQGIIGNTLPTVFTRQNTVSLHKRAKKCTSFNLNLCKFCTGDIPVKFSFLETVVEQIHIYTNHKK